MGYEIKFLFRTDDPISVKVQGRDRQGADRGRLQGHPGADHDGELPRGTRQHQRGHQRPLGRLVLRLAVRFDLAADRARVDQPGQDPLVRCQLLRVRQQVRRRPDGRHPEAAAGPAGGTPGTPWTSRSPQKYFPLFTTYYAGIAQAHGSKIQGDNDDNTLGMPTWKDIWVSPVTSPVDWSVS